MRSSALELSAGERSSVIDAFPDASAGSRWFAVYTSCRHEKRVAQHFGHRDIDFYLPLYRSERKWRDGSKVALELPLFPSYIFVHIKRSEKTSVLSVPGALALVGGTGGEPAPLPDASIEALRIGLSEQKVEPHAVVRVGQEVRIRTGAFAGMRGVVVRKKSGFRVVLTLEQIMQGIAVEVGEEDLDPVGTANDFTEGFSAFRPCFNGL